MKTLKYLTIAILILAGLGVSSNLNANSDKLKKIVVVKNELNLTIPARVLHHIEISPVEEWMFNAAYLDEQASAGLENWMLDGTYLDECSGLVEDWMLDEHYLEDEATAGVESWMLNPAYLAR